MNNPLRNGNFTSSEIVKLTKLRTNKKDFGEAANTYIAETNFERYLDDSIDAETGSKPTSWGTFLEPRVFDLLGMDYTYSSAITDTHPTIPYWVGSKDGTRENIDTAHRAVIDIKCPMTKKSFVQLVLPLYLGLTGMEVMYALRDGFNYNGFEYAKHTDGAKYYWQIVSNAIINGCNYGELIVYMPYESELLEILEMAKGNPSVRWMEYVADGEIPCIKDGGFFKNLNTIRFEIPQADKDFITEQVLKAGEMLIDKSQVVSKAA